MHLPELEPEVGKRGGEGTWKATVGRYHWTVPKKLLVTEASYSCSKSCASKPYSPGLKRRNGNWG